MKKTVSKASIEKPEVFRLGEIGYNGFRTSRGIPNNETEPELRFPKSIKTFNKMSKNSVVNASEGLFGAILDKVTPIVVPVVDATEEEKKQAEIIKQAIDDMDHSWGEFIQNAYTSWKYGFSLCEMVFRRRYVSNGSKFNDGVIAWQSLPIRVQESITRFYDKTVDGFDGAEQDISLINKYSNYSSSVNTTTKKIIPLSKLLHFKTGRHRGDPHGYSALKDAYVAWWYLTELEKIELTGISKDLVGLPVLYIPPNYMSDTASPSEKAVYEYYKNALRNLQNNEQGSMIMPQIYDPETRAPLFKIELMSIQGQKSYDIDKVKQYYKNMIVLSLSTDILTMGQSQVGSFALGSLKNSIAGSTAQSLVKVILDEVNRKLIRKTYELNGWDISRMCTIDVDGLQDIDLEAVSKYWSRMSAGGLVEVDREVLNIIRTIGGVDAKAVDEPVNYETLSGQKSKVGEGYKTLGEGTAIGLSPTDASSENLENNG